jgi:hypothetical protein
MLIEDFCYNCILSEHPVPSYNMTPLKCNCINYTLKLKNILYYLIFLVFFSLSYVLLFTSGIHDGPERT